MVENWFKEMIFFHCGPWFPQELITASAICFEFWTYNHGQKSWDTFAFLGRFPIHTGPTPPLTPETVLHACIQNFCRVSTLYGVGGRENCKKILKSMHCFKREPITHQTCTEPLEKHLEKPPPPPRKLPRFFPPLLCNENFTYYNTFWKCTANYYTIIHTWYYFQLDCRTPEDTPGIVFLAEPVTAILPLISISNVKNSDHEICSAFWLGFPFLNFILLTGF